MATQSNGKNKEIIQSATRVFSQKGFADATLSEIAKGADMATSGIYSYYKNKEALLFRIIENFLVESCDGLFDHLQGIHGPENKLRKAIWFHCKSYSGNKKEIQIILEARSYPRFYKSSAYDALKHYARFFTDIIQEGMEQGSFGHISSPALLRDIILGTVDHIAINWTLKDAANPLEQSQRLYDLILLAIEPGGADFSQNGKLDKKAAKRSRIINAATTLFAEKGFNDTSMLGIARSARVAEGTVYEYFGSKENLLISIPGGKLGTLHDTLSGNSPEHRIKEIIARIFEFYSNERAYSTILVLMLRTNRKFHASPGHQMIENLFDMIHGEIRKGQELGMFRADLDMDICRDLLFGTLDHIMIPMIIFKRKYKLSTLGSQVSDFFINMISKG
ncbi:MAG: TetR/AcrR family transcriptional regulator [Desulfobacterales bacterium]|nr:TetR/AcrR family transcriptional regulator [Desulfobacterales bacterium]